MHMYISLTLKKIYFLRNGVLRQLSTDGVSYQADTDHAPVAPVKGRQFEAGHNRIIRDQLLLAEKTK